MPPSPLAVLYASEADLQAYLGTDGETGRLDDDNDGQLSLTERGYLTNVLNYATAKVNSYLLKLYSANDLAGDWLVNRWTVAVALYELSCRRGNPSPGSTKDIYDAAIKDMDGVRAGVTHLDLGLRQSMFPAWSNMRVNAFRRLRKLVVERPISDAGPGGTAAQQPATSRDVGADFILDPR